MNHTPTTLITGAGKRIGASIARHLAARGHNLVLHYHHSRAEAEALKQEIVASRQSSVVSKGEAPSITLVQANLEDTASLAGFWKDLPPVTNIIHNASTYKRDRLESFTLEELRAHMAVNFEAPLILTQGFMKQLPPAATGNIIVLGDDALGWSISPEFFTYAVSKHSWRAMIDLLAASVAPRARANLLALAPTLPGEGESSAMFARLAAQASLKRTGELDEVTRAIDFILASPGLTGQTLRLGNGMGLATARPH